MFAKIKGFGQNYLGALSVFPYIISGTTAYVCFGDGDVRNFGSNGLLCGIARIFWRLQ